jgi:hypothetical protein
MHILLKSLLTEALDQMYHATDIWKLVNILKSDTLKFTYADASKGESMMSREYPFYLSTSREKYGGYARGHKYGMHLSTVIVLNGKALERTRGIKIFDVDYWGGNSGERGREHNETEERVVSTNQKLVGLGKYVQEIHVYCYRSTFDPDKNNASRCYRNIHHVYYPIIEFGKELNIPIYFYVENSSKKIASAFKMQRRDMALTPEKAKEFFADFEQSNEEFSKFIKTAKPEELEPDKDRPKWSWSDGSVKEIQYLIDIIDHPYKYVTVDYKTQKELSHLLDYFITYTRDLIPHFESLIHNMRSEHPEIFQDLSKSIRRSGYKNIRDALSGTSSILQIFNAIKNVWSYKKYTHEDKMKMARSSYVFTGMDRIKVDQIIKLVDYTTQLETLKGEHISDDFYKKIVDIIKM